jgi:hypothetical protein
MNLKEPTLIGRGCQPPAPLDPRSIRKSFSLKAVMICTLKESMQTMTAFVFCLNFGHCNL